MILPLNKSIKLAFGIALFESIVFLLSLITKANIHPWYETLNKSILPPPRIRFFNRLAQSILSFGINCLGDVKPNTKQREIF